MPKPGSGWHRPRNMALVAARRAKYASPEHRAARVAFKVIVAGGNARCWRCGLAIAPGTAFDVGHSDDGLVIRGPEHRSCNKRAAASKGAKVANARRKAARFTRAVR